MEYIKTTADILKLELMQKCNCELKLEAIFVCSDVNCKDHERQQYYCMECMETAHDHKPKYIVKEI